jgi:imidazolonepropionase-like amidohydrolase
MAQRRIVAGRLVFDGTDGDPIEQGAILVNGERIEVVGTRSALTERAPDAELIDCGQQAIVPGLIDAHIHLFRTVRHQISEAEAILRAARAAKRVLFSGLTTIRELGTTSPTIFHLKNCIDEGLIPGPRIVAAGASIAMTGGHAYDGISVEGDGPDEIMKLARQQIKNGAGVIKLMATGGTSGKHEHFGSPQLTLRELQAAAEVAHNANRPVAIHALNDIGARNAIMAGADSLEHGAIMSDETIAMLVEKDIALVPTVGVYEMLYQRGAQSGAAPHFVAAATAVRVQHMDTFKRAIKAGVRVIFGTDATSSFLPPGDTEPDLHLWVQAGLSSRRILRAMTRDAAEVLRLGEQVGTLEPGKYADLVVVDGNPAEDVMTLAHPARVMKGGRFIQRDWDVELAPEG